MFFKSLFPIVNFMKFLLLSKTSETVKFLLKRVAKLTIGINTNNKNGAIRKKLFTIINNIVKINNGRIITGIIDGKNFKTCKNENIFSPDKLYKTIKEFTKRNIVKYKIAEIP